jgi:hypothetical protein
MKMTEIASDGQHMVTADSPWSGWPRTTPSEALLTETIRPPPASATRANWLQSVRSQFDKIGSLAPNWDGEGAQAPKIEILCSAVGLLDTILRHAPTISEPYIRPTPSGGILLAWQRENEDLEVELEMPGIATFVHTRTHGSKFFDGVICEDGRPLQDDDREFLRILSQFASA